MAKKIVDQEALKRFKTNLDGQTISDDTIDDIIGTTVSTAVDNGTLREDMSRVKQSLGPYSDRTSIQLAAKETGVAISSGGVKTAKDGWAIAEFTAVLGNEYLFKPGATDGGVSVFAEYIDKQEQRGIDYAYTYDQQGRTATASATYNGKAYSYSYSYSSDDTKGENPSITDTATGKAVGYLPATYQTTVGTYQPLTILNAGAELPQDGYCRFVSNFQQRASMRVVVSYKADAADLTVKVVRDGMTASMCSQLSRVNQKVDEVKAATESLARQTSSGGALFAGFSRPNGDVSPEGQTAYGDKALIHKIGKHLRMAVVKDGKATYLAPGRITLTEDGEAVAIDGSAGDVLCATDTELWLMRATGTKDGADESVMGLSEGPCSWQGNAAKRIAKFGMTPGYTVNAKTGDDVRSQAHSVYGTGVKGSWSAPDSLFKTASPYAAAAGGGLPTSGVSGLASIQQAQNKNADALTARPYMGLHPDQYMTWIALMYAELGTLDSTQLARMGTGCTTQDAVTAATFCDAQMSGNSGVKLITSAGAATYAPLSGQSMTPSGGGDAVYNVKGLNGSMYAFTEMLEAQRVMDAITRDGLTSKVGRQTTFFYFDASGKMLTVEKSSTFDVTTGAGMTAGVKYYQVRDVPGCEGLQDGVMTGVVNCYLLMMTADGVTLANGTSMTGGKAIFKFSHSVYRGLSMPMDGMFRHLSYAYRVMYGHGADKSMETVFATTYNVEDTKAMTSFGQDTWSGSTEDTLAALDGLDLRMEKVTAQSGWIKKGDYSVSPFAMTATGGGSHSYEAAYLWNTASYGGAGDANGKLAEGKKQINASVSGCSAYYGAASARTLVCYYGLGVGSSFYAGAFAVLL